MEKLYISKAFLKMADGRMHAPHPTPLYPPLAISYRNHQKSLAYFSHLIITISSFVLFYQKAESKGGRGHGPIAQTHFRRHKHPARENQRYCSSAVKLARSFRTPRSLFSHLQLGTAVLQCNNAVLLCISTV